MQHKQSVILVTGLSGAGKTSVMAILEDMGYYCMDGFPSSLLPSLSEDMQKGSDVHYARVAVATGGQDFEAFYRCFRNLECDLSVLFLEASKEQLLHRYKYNRRYHPLLINGSANSLEEAIDMEIAELSRFKEMASIIIDTSFLTPHSLSSRIQRYFKIGDKPELSISFISFGYKQGLPLDADFVFDVRFLSNPFWHKELKDKTGNNKEVYHFVIDDEKTQSYLPRLVDFLSNSFKEYEKENKSHITVAIGCTGGQHRSVSIVNYLYRYFKHDYHVFKNHRDLKE